MSTMRQSALVLAFLVVTAAGCGSGSTPQGSTCTIPDAGPGTPSTCSNPPGQSTATGSETVDRLGTLRVSQQVSFQVPQNTVSITIIEQAVSAPDTITYQPPQQSSFTLDNTAVPLKVVDPSGKVVYDDNPVASVTDPNLIANQLAFFGSSSPVTGTLTVPNTTGGLNLIGTSGALAAGQWSMTVSDYAYECTFQQASGACCSGGSTASTYDVTIITKQHAGGGIPTSGSLDVVVYFATTTADLPDGTPSPLSATAANAGTDPDLARMQQTLTTLLGKAAVDVNSVTYVDLPADVLAVYSGGVNIDQTGACSDMAALLRHGADGNKLNIFFVSSFQASDLSAGNTVVGLDGTIPGPASVGGTAASGVAVATHDLRRTVTKSGTQLCPSGSINPYDCGPDETAYIIAHEAGHYLGLYHVTESDGTLFDPLLDTPMCPCSTCAPAASKAQCADATPAPASGNAYQVQVADCVKSTSCGGGDNLMFWILDNGSLGTLTDEQQRVMRANPLLQ